MTFSSFQKSLKYMSSTTVNNLKTSSQYKREFAYKLIYI